MERNPNQTHMLVSNYSGSASEQQPPSGCSTDQKEGGDQYNGYPPYKSFSQEQQQQPAHRDQQPSGPPPRWARALVRLILESSFPR